VRPETSVSDLARYALGAVRLVNGGLCLLAPARATRQMGVEPEANPAALYVLRLFGIRTVMIGAEVFVLRGEELARSLRLGLLIHACDGVSAVAAGASGHLPTRTAARAAAISALNVTLSAVALRAARPHLG
jgi:hypothetical protein